ncbi:MULTISPECIES: PQQ-dependent sugar dehydrogenase [unclassified Amycolatopsis]|uniref:PQQ-dependent sugar dehydrogenase n=1 Tax=unclassified Amycolatopsis TaxID=2618356 RepID=UPI0028749352|nr:MULTISPECIES: PQQ-dependent sugar dehydrogenase [unclassified Amycolatopsis]MDS0139408.1 PQQ-dependent sugar dehydrogenase [Amycolatopsis sp. 505]MDS0146987.1 PQQ-dependent sugar dehydrogenase [Amycolatopsis sp. CM201R]
MCTVVLAGFGVVLPAPAASAATVDTNASYVLVNRNSGKALDVAGSATYEGARVTQSTRDDRASQQWQFVDSGGGNYRIKSKHSAKILTFPSTADRAGLVQNTDAGRAGQQFRLADSAGGDVRLLNRASGKAVDVLGSSTADGARVVQLPDTGGANQRWQLVKLAADTTPPTAPANPRTTNLTCATVTFSWSASSDDTGVAYYDIFHDGQLMTSVPGTALSAELTVAPGATWGLYVNARDAAGNVSQASPTVTIAVPQCQADTEPPSTPTGVTATASGTTVTVRWSPATDNVGVTGYEVLRDGTVAGSTSGSATTSFTDSGLAANTRYQYQVRARDAQANRSAPSSPVAVTTGASCATAVCSVTRVTTETDLPWGLTTLPDGQVLYGRRDAFEIVRLDPATGTKTVAGRMPDVAGTDGEGGVLGLAVATDFAADPWLYVMHTSTTDNRVVRIRYTGGVLSGTPQVLLTGIPRNKYHNGGRLRFGPDGKLYIAAGDGQNGDWAQDLANLAGKVLRINRDGTIPSDNPFGTPVWSYGHRNPQGLAFDAQGRLWEQEFGNNVMDETNLIVRGGNYGWPRCEGTTGSCAEAGFVAPKRTYPVAEGSCSGIAVVRDALYIACLRGTRLYRAEISGDSLTNVQQYLTGTYGRLRTVEPSADGGLWLTTSNYGDKDSIANNSNESILKVELGR